MINTDDKRIKEAVAKIENCLPDKDVYNGQLFQQFYKAVSSCDFTRKSLKRINIKNAEFKRASFVSAAGTGSKFKETVFHKCDFSDANFQSCYFNKCNFQAETLIKGANFSHSVFIDCSFTNITIKQSTLYDCHFENCSFASCRIYSDTLENTLFYGCTISHVDLAHINLEYIQFKNIVMDDVKLPPYQAAYIIGAPQYIKSTSDNVKIYTDKGDINAASYSELYEDLALYYYSHGEYFPLANILMALNRNEDAFEYIKTGIEESCDYFDFRMIKHFCRLLCSNDNYTPGQLKNIYNLITNLSFNSNWDLNTLHSYMIHIGAIRELLLNNSASDSKQRVELLIKTDIEKDDLVSINELYNKINLLIRDNCSEQHVDCIELRHNSPYELYITFIDTVPYILGFLSSVYGVLAVGNKFLNIYKNILETRKTWQENDLFKYQKEKAKLEIQLTQLELEEKRKKRNPSSIYTVTEIEHNIKCNTLDIAKTIAPEILHYKYKREKPEL